MQNHNAHTNFGKVTWLVVALSFCFFLTAYTARHTYNENDKLRYWAGRLQTAIQKKENYIDNILKNNKRWHELKVLQNNTSRAIEYTQTLSDQNIILLLYKRGHLVYWSSNQVIPEGLSGFQNKRQLYHYTNGYYEAVRKTDADFTALFFIPIKSNYIVSNNYLPGEIVTNLPGSGRIDIALQKSRFNSPVYTSDKGFLFDVKLTDEINGGFFSRLEMICYFAGLLMLCIAVHLVCERIAKNGHIGRATLGLFLFICALRLVNIAFGIPDLSIDFDLFKANIYADSAYAVFSLGDFLLNILLFAWLASFVYIFRFGLINRQVGGFWRMAILILCVFCVMTVGAFFSSLFHSLIINSKISFNVNNVFDLSGYSIIGALALCLSSLVFYLVAETALTVCFYLQLSFRTILTYFGLAVVLLTLWSFTTGFTIYFLLVGCIVLVIGYNIYFHKGEHNPPHLLTILFLLSTIAGVKLAAYQQEKERIIRRNLIDRLASPVDYDDNYKLATIEKQIEKDPVIQNFFSAHNEKTEFLETHLKRQYFDEFYKKYDIGFYTFDARDSSLSTPVKYDLQDFQSLVFYGSIKLSDYFYRTSSTFGNHNYLAVIPVQKKGIKEGTLVIDLHSTPLENNSSFPQLFTDQKQTPIVDTKEYSLAFFNDKKLITHKGNFVFNQTNTRFHVDVHQYRYYNLDSYSHLVYRPSETREIVISKQEQTFFDRVAAMTFFFVFFLVFTLILLLLVWAVSRIRAFKPNLRNIRWSFILSTSRILYKTRIQSSIILSVVMTLLIAGFITYLSISRQYDRQQNDLIREKTSHITSELEKDIFSGNGLLINEDTQVKFYNFARIYSSDLTIFDLNGVPVLTTQPKIYDLGFIGRRICTEGYLNLYKLHQSEFINTAERIGDLDFKAGYAPIKDIHKNIIGFLQVPYFTNQADYQERIGAFFNTLINVYALIFLAIGLIAVVVANQITAPLTFIQQNLRRVSYGHKNEPIPWRRNDEIGSLIKEYNNMLVALDESAKKLGESERKGAWREMAKQVAHEIKNPLTPMKLGLQLLEKSWREEDEKFNEKFERFSKSFIEQIESLAHIATEFSNFAKMPETRVELVRVDDLLQSAVDVFMLNDKVPMELQKQDSRNYTVKADRDQLLRCFNNLLKNAIEAVPRSDTGMVQIGLDADGPTVYINIKDNGLGIPPRIIDKIFEPNFTTKSSGTGLGLAFVKNAIENMGGSIRFETEVYQGTTFFITLPVQQNG